MYWSLSLLLLPLLFAEITCSGFFHIRLKSQYLQDAKLLVGLQGKPASIAVPIRLHSGTTRKLGPFPIEFKDKYTLTIMGGGVEKLGINGSTHTAEFEPSRGTLAPKQLHLPLNGLELIFECDEKWTGSKCDERCSYYCTTTLVNEAMEVSTDYSIDMTKLPEIVKRLKGTTKVENEIRQEEMESKKRVENHKDVLGASKQRESPKSLFLDLFSNILNFKPSIAKSIDETPSQMDVEEKAPWTIMRRFAAQKRDGDEESKIEKHSSLQKTFGLRHRKPSQFGGLDGPAKSMLPLFQPLMGLMPRITGRFDGSIDDFKLDQIFRN